MIIRLEQFNLNEAIQSYNKTAKKKVPEDTHFDFLFFTLLPKVNQIIEGINTSKSLFRFNAHELRALQRQNEHMKKLLEYLSKKTFDSDEFDRKKSMGADLNLVQTVNKKIGFYTWKDKQIEYLTLLPIKISKKELNVNPEQAQCINNMKEKWVFCEHTHHALWKIVSRDLPMLRNYHQGFLTNRPKSKKIPKPIYAEYVKYCERILEQSEKLKHFAIESMLVRLEELASSDFQECDPLYYYIKELKKNKFLDKKMKLPPTVDPLSANLFYKFHTYIHQHGNVSEKNRLYALPWFKEKGYLRTKNFNNGTGKIIVPESMSPWMPGKLSLLLSKYPRLFPKHAARRQLIIDNQYLFAYLKMSKHQQNPIDIPNAIEFLRSGCEKLDLVKKSQDDLQKKTVLRKDMLALKMKCFLNEQNTKLLLQQLQFMEQFIEHLTKINKTPRAIILNYEQSQILKLYYEDLKVRVKNHTEEKSLKPRWRALKRQLLPLLSLNRNFLVVDNMAQGKEVSEIDFKELLEQYQCDLSCQSTQAAALRELIQPLLGNILRNFLQELELSLFSLRGKNAFKKHAEKIFNYYTFLEQFCQPFPSEIIAKKLNKYVLKYFEFLTHTKTENPEVIEIMGVMESILSRIAKNHSVLGEPILNLINELKEMYSNGSWLIGKTKVQAWRALLNDQMRQRSFEKDVSRLDDYIFSLFLNDPGFSYSPASVEILRSIRDQLVEQSTTSLSSLDLERYKYALIGYDEKHSVVVDLIVLSAKAHIKQNQLKQNSLNLEPSKNTTELSISAMQTLRKHEKTKHCQFLFGIGKNKRGLFTQFFENSGDLNTPRRHYHTI
ncbi:MAG: hypothetical protein JSS53_06630 [Proteobacteria bacterium]|nr:hypothetical protein [Pseudomonadota bacterium]